MSPPERRKLVISADDLEDAPPTAPAPAAGPPPPAPQAFPTVDGVRRPAVQFPAPTGAAPSHPAASAPSALNNTHARNLAAAAVGIVVAWVVTELLNIPDWSAGSRAALNFNAAVFVGFVGFFLAVIYTGWEHLEARSTEGLLLVLRRAGPVGAGLGFVAGFLANVLYMELAEQAFESGSHVSLYIARMLGWAIFGVGIGVATATLVRSRQKVVNGALGGLAGGAAGGIIFEFVGERISSAGFARLIGLLVVGAGIGLAIGLVETLRRQAWFHIVGGGMAGKEFVLYEGETRVGSSPLCDVTVIKDPGVQPYHFTVSPETAGRRTLTAYQGCAVTINGAPVAQHTLRNGDAIGVGSTTIRYAERTTGGQPWT